MKAADRRPSASLLFLLVPVLLIAAGVRILGLGNADLWGDEAFSVMTSLGPPSKLLGILATAEPHPPLYPFLLAVWLRLFGSSEFVARLPSAFFGIASVPVAVSLATEWARGRKGWWLGAVAAGLLVALNPFQVWYSQEARMYAQVSFFAGLATLALLRVWRGKRGAIPFYALAIVGAAGSHYYGLFVPLAHFLAVLVCARGNRPALLRWLRAAALAAVLYLPWVYVALRIFTSYYGGASGSEDLVHVAISSWARVTAGWSLSWSDAVTYASILSAIALIGLIVPSRSESDRFLRIVLGFWLFTPFVGGYLVSLVRPLYNERYLIVCSLPFILLMARGIAWVGSWGLGIGRRGRGWAVAGRSVGILGGAAGLCLALAVAYPALHNFWSGAYLESDYHTPVKTADLLAQTGDVVILNGPAQEDLYAYYAGRPLPHYTLPRKTPLDPATTTEELAGIAQDHRGAWVFWYATALYDPSNVIGHWLADHAYRSLDVYATNARLQYYRFAPDDTLKKQSTSLNFGDSFALQSYSWADASVAAGVTVPVDLRWHRLPGAVAHPRVALRLVDAAGLTWAQTDQSIGNGFVADDHWPDDQILDDRHGLMIPTGTPPGDYDLLLNVYSPDHPKALAVNGKGATIAPAGVKLATIHVSEPSRTIWTGGIAGFRPSTASFASGVNLLGSAGSDRVKAGESGYLTLVWKAATSAPSAARLHLELLTPDGRVAEQRDVPLATAAYPPTKWRAGDILREQYLLPIDVKLAAGVYRIAVRPVSSPPEATSTQPVEIGSIEVQPGVPPPMVSPPQHPLTFQLADWIALTGYDLGTNQVHPGDTVDLALHWSDLAPIDGDYTVFVHVLDSSSKVVAQRDQQPLDGKRPTSSWFPDDTILDSYKLTLPATLPPGSYAVEVGMYNASTGERLAVSHDGAPAGDRIILTNLDVTK